ncbi:MAG: hypothetical protein AB1601_14075 [Planctomycetota bacterium]
MIGDDEFTRYYAPLLDDMYDVVDRITINARYHFACTPGGFRCWWFDRFGTFDNLNDTFLMRLAGRYGRRVQGWANKHKIPVVDCRKGVRKDQLIKEYLPADPNFVGVFAIFTTRRPSPVWRVLRSDKNPASFHLEYKNPRPWVKHYHFHIMDKTWGHVIVSMSGHPPHPALIILNGHEYTACQARRRRIVYEKEDNCFTALSDSRKFAEVADALRSSAAVGQLRRVCDRWVYWCACFGVSFEEQKRSRFRYDYSVYQVEYSRNLLFRSGRYMERVFDGLIDRTRATMNVKRVMKIFGCRARRLKNPKRLSREQVVLERPAYDLTVFKLHFGGLTLKMYTKGEHVLRTEAMVEQIDRLACGRMLDRFPAMIQVLSDLLQTFLNHLQCIDMPWVTRDQLDTLAQPGQVGATRTAGLDIDKSRMRAVIHAVIALSLKPGGFTAAEHAAMVNQLTGNELRYASRQSAYDLRKLRGKQLVVKTHPKARRYQSTPDALRTMSGLIVLRQKVIEPLLKYLGRAKSGNLPRDTAKIDRYFRDMQHVMTKVFQELHLIGEHSIRKVLAITAA